LTPFFVSCMLKKWGKESEGNGKKEAV